MSSAVSRVAAYLVLVIAPVAASAVWRPREADPLLTELGTRFALLGLAILAMQFVLSARIRWVERPFGLDSVYRFHKSMAVFAVLLLISHPALVAAGDNKWGLLTTFQQSWHVLLGKGGLALLIVLAIVSLFRLALRLEFEKWRKLHNVVAAAVLGIGSTHGWIMSGDPERLPTRVLLFALVALGAAAYINHRVLVPAAARRNAYRVVGVKLETHNVWTLQLAPPAGRERFDYLPGQFHFLTLRREPGLPVEEHPFTISSSPIERGLIASTIKESGDFTSTIGRTKPGDLAAVEGPFGRFSHVVHPGESRFAFIAGGIGITPLMSMLRHMRDTGSDADVHLIYANRTEDDIVFREELAAIESGGSPRLEVTHVLDSPNQTWQGETGFVDRDKIERLLGDDLLSRACYVCGPPPMMGSVIRALRQLGVPVCQIHYERFSL